MRELEARGYPPELVRAVASHADFMGVSRESPMEKALFAVDELSGFILAGAYVRPEGLSGMTPKSVKKKLKQPSFAAAVNREELRQGAEELGVDFDEHLDDRDRGAGGAAGRADARRIRIRIRFRSASGSASGTAQHPPPPSRFDDGSRGLRPTRRRSLGAACTRRGSARPRAARSAARTRCPAHRAFPADHGQVSPLPGSRR